MNPGIKLIDDFSLEMTGKDVPGLHEAQHALPAGTRINVTFLGNEDLEMRVAAAKAVKEAGFTPVAHISARRIASPGQLEEFLSALREVDAIENVFCVGGDPETPMGPYASALDLIQSGRLPEFGVKEVSIAGYPEGHPDISDADLWDHLERKSTALTEQGLGRVVLTQFGFDTDPVISWIREVRERGIDAPLRIGVPGPAGIKRLLAFARRFGVGANAMIVKKYGFSLTNLMGTAGPDRFVNELGTLVEDDPTAGDVGIHLYTFGGLLATAEWAQKFRKDAS